MLVFANTNIKLFKFIFIMHDKKTSNIALNFKITSYMSGNKLKTKTNS